MKLKNYYKNLLKEINSIAKNQECNIGIIENIIELEEKLEKFIIKIPIIGGFNAGKSSLINQYLGRDLLKTDIVPETAISTEIRYGEFEQVLAYRKDESFKTYNINQLNEIDSKEYKYLEVIISNEKIKNLEDIILVDMPGIDSNVEEHNKAILNYIKEGVFYILATDVEHGLKESSLKFLDEISDYGIDFSVILTKSDKKIDNDLQDIKQNVKQTLYSLTSQEIKVELTSSKLGDVSKFDEIIKSIDKEILLKNKFGSNIEDVIEKVQKELMLRLKTQDLDEKTLKDKIDTINKKIEDLNRKLKNEEQDIEYKFNGQVKSNILNDTRMSLESNSSVLLNAYKQGEHNFKNKVNEIIRPTLIKSSNINISNTFESSIKNVNTSLLEMNDLVDFGNTTLNKINDGTNILNTIVNTIQNPTMRIGLAGLAATTALIAPWLELTILFLPEVLKLFGFNNEKKKDESLLSSIRNEIIPKIISGLDGEISNNLSKTKDEFIINLKNEVKESEKELLNSLEKVLDERALKREEFQNKINNINKDLEILEKLKKQI